MCRLLAYLGQPALLAEVVLWPDRSIIIQSFDARERKRDPNLPQHVGFGNLNGDGFGIGWFGEQGTDDRKPCVFTSVTPAWNNENLNRLSEKIISPLMFAHVRAAYPGMPVSEQNCHPFQFNHYLWMHNGVIAGFVKVRRKLASLLSDEAFNAVPSLLNSDSAMAFALFLNHLPDLEANLPSKTLLEAIEATVAAICRVTDEAGVTGTSLLNFVVSDGSTMVATRFVSREGEAPASLYYAEGWSFEKVSEAEPIAPDTPGNELAEKTPGVLSQQNEYALTHSPVGSKLVMVASEPITKSCTDWMKVPPNTSLVVTREKGGFVNVLRSPLSAVGNHPLRAEVRLCLEAVGDGRSASGRLWQVRSSSEAEDRGFFTEAERQQQQQLSRSGESPTSAARQQQQQVQALSPSGPREPASPQAQPPVSLRPEHTLTGHKKAVICMVEHKGRLYSASADKTIQVWDISDVKWVGRLEGHERPIVSLRFMGDRLFSVAGRTIRVWDVDALQCIRIVHLGHAQMTQLGECSYRGGACRAFCFGDNSRVYAAMQDSNLSVFSSADWLAPGSSPPPNVALGDPGLEATPPPDASPEGTSPGGAAPASRAAIIAQSEVSTGDDAFDDVARGRAKGHLGTVNDVILIKWYLCSCGDDAMIRALDPETLEPKGTLRGHRGSVLCLAAAGDLLLSGGRDNTIRVWDMDGMCCRRTLQGHKHDVLSISTMEILPRCPEGRQRGRQAPSFHATKTPFLFASASADSTARLWCGIKWVCLRVFSPAAGVAGPFGSGWSFSRPHMRRTSSQLGSRDLLAPHNPGICITCAPGMNINQVTQQVLRRHHRRNNHAPDHSSAAVVERSGASLKGLVLGPQHLIVSNMEGEIYVYSMASVFEEALKKCSESQPKDELCPERCAKRGRGELQGCDAEPITPKRLRLRIQTNCDTELVSALRELVGIPSVSADKRLQDECFRSAKFIARQLEILGAEVKMAQEVEGRNPVVIGRLGRKPDVPTVTFYGHYDVQPALEDGWRTNPFEMASIDGYLYGRGTSDNKGPVLGFLFAVKELMESCAAEGKELPINCAFCFEGEEENGSHGFAATLEANQHWFSGTEVVLVSNTLWIGETRPCLTYALRGLICLDVGVTGLKRDLHSGNDGGVFNEPMVDLVNVIGTLVDGRNSILVPGFSEDIEEHHRDRKILEIIDRSGEFNLDDYREYLGVPSLLERRSASDLLYERWCAPSLSIVDIRAGDTANEEILPECYRFGPTRFSVIPHRAVGKVSIRFVPKQRPENLISCIKSHLQHEFAKLRSSNKLEITVRNIGDWWEADTDSRLFKAAERAVEREWNLEPLHVREGGTMPMIATLEKTLRAPAIMLPFGQASNNPHLANERIRGVNLLRGKNVVRNFLEELVNLRK